MKTHIKPAVSVTVMGIALALAWSGPAVGQVKVIVTPPTIVVSPPVVITPVPDYYVWDGSEYVGVVGDQYYYLGPGDVWIIMDPPRMHRFDVWERGHGDWRAHATRNTRYRGGDRDRAQQMRSSLAPETRSSGPPQTRSSGPAPRTRNNSPPPNANQGSHQSSDRHGRDQNGSHNGPPH